MRTIQVSTDVYAAIWRAHAPGEHAEDDILRRLLGVAPTAPEQKPREHSNAGGYRDSRYGVMFPEGFEISRTFKGVAYRATVKDGAWLLANDGKRYGTLNALGDAIGAGTENLWDKWRFTDESGAKTLIGGLRDPEKVLRRGKKKTLTAADLGLDD